MKKNTICMRRERFFQAMVLMVSAALLNVIVFSVVEKQKQNTIQYHREELVELFGTFPVTMLQKEFEGKNIVLLDPMSIEDYAILISALDIDCTDYLKLNGNVNTVHQGMFSNGEPYALLENDEESILSVQISDSKNVRALGAYMCHKDGNSIVESFFKSDTAVGSYIKITYYGKTGKIS